MADARYTSSLTKEVVEVLEVGAVGARCRTIYNSEVIVQWNTNLPDPVPQVGECWFVDRVSNARWTFVSKAQGDRYNIMRYAMSLDMRSCIGRERPIIDDIAASGVQEVFLRVAGEGIVFWKSEVAEKYGLSVCEVDGEPADMVRQVVDRCKAAGLSVVFVMGCDLWSDTGDPTHNLYQQVEMDNSYIMGGWLGAKNFTWRQISYMTWRAVLESAWNSAEHAYRPTWSFVNAKEPVRLMVEELYEAYSADVRGICFDGWHVNGAYADVSDYVDNLYRNAYGKPIVSVMAGNSFSTEWWGKRDEMTRFFAGLQENFIEYVRGNIGNWPISAMVPSKVICCSSEMTGRYETWVDDDFGTYGWSLVGCTLEYQRSIDRAAELRSLEYCTASLKRLAEGSTPLYCMDFFQMDEYDGALEILAKYDASNVLIGEYEQWRLLSDQQVIKLKDAMNKYSVTPISRLDDIGFYVSNNSRDVYFRSELEPNMFSLAAENMCAALLDKLPHRLRVLYDADMENEGVSDNVAAIVLFESINMSEAAVEVVNGLLDREDKNVVIIGLCGRSDRMAVERRYDIPFLDKFGERDYGNAMYSRCAKLRAGRIDAADNVYVMEYDVEGIAPLYNVDKATAAAVGYDADGNEVALPILFSGRSSAISMDILNEPAMMDMASDMALYAIGRDA